MTARPIAIALSLAAALLFGACGGQPAAPGGQGAVSAPADLAQLPPTIDVATADALRANPEVVLIDVREPDEYAAGHIPGATLIPLGQVQQRLAEIPTDKTVVVTCRSGNRSAQAAEILRSNGYTRIHNMQGGFAAWEAAGLPVER